MKLEEAAKVAPAGLRAARGAGVTDSAELVERLTAGARREGNDEPIHCVLEREWAVAWALATLTAADYPTCERLEELPPKSLEFQGMDGWIKACLEVNERNAQRVIKHMQTLTLAATHGVVVSSTAGVAPPPESPGGSAWNEWADRVVEIYKDAAADRATTHAQFVTSYNSGELAVSVDRSLAHLVIQSPIIPRSVRWTQAFYGFVWILFLPASVACFIWANWIIGLVLLAAFALLYQAIVKSERDIVIHQALKSPSVFAYCIDRKVMVLCPMAKRTCQ